MMLSPDRFDEHDLAVIEARGTTPEKVSETLSRLRSPRRFVKLVRAAGSSDRLLSLSPDILNLLANRFQQLNSAPGKFTPMSGAASRMFEELDRLRGKGATDQLESLLNRCLAGTHKVAFTGTLTELLSRAGSDLDDLLCSDPRKVADYIVGPKGLALASKPKALIPFHVTDGREVTPLEEHMREAADYGRNVLHISISPEHDELYDAAIREIIHAVPEFASVRIDRSVQDPSTDSVAIYADTQELVRDEDGRLIFFPAGHGSLIKNAGNIGSPFVLRNVDNVPNGRDARKQVILWHRALSVLLADIKGAVHGALTSLDGHNRPAAKQCLKRLEPFGVRLPHCEGDGLDDGKLKCELNRPIRLVGVVPNQSEPGGGPFVIEHNGRQIMSIVEKDEIAPDQQFMIRDGAYFNPVDIVADTIDYRGCVHDLAQFINPDRYFLVEKPYRGRTLRRLEHPGLWNGAMDGWLSVFVILPLATFAPVKTMTDLLRKEHQSDELIAGTEI
jgi:hypothetical protein